MSFSASTNDISTFLDKNQILKDQNAEIGVDAISQESERTIYKPYEDGDHTLPLLKFEDTRSSHRYPFLILSKMNSIEEGEEEDNEEDDTSNNAHISLDATSMVSRDSTNLLQIPIASTASPHPQRHSRWTSRFLTHPSHWKTSANTPPAPAPLLDPKINLEQSTTKAITRNSITAKSRVPSSSHNKGSAKNHNTFEEWQTNSAASWAMNLPPPSLGQLLAC